MVANPGFLLRGSSRVTSCSRTFCATAAQLLRCAYTLRGRCGSLTLSCTARAHSFGRLSSASKPASHHATAPACTLWLAPHRCLCASAHRTGRSTPSRRLYVSARVRTAGPGRQQAGLVRCAHQQPHHACPPQPCDADWRPCCSGTALASPGPQQASLAPAGQGLQARHLQTPS